MSLKLVHFVLPCLPLALTAPVWGQKAQIWKPLVNGTVESRVFSCANPQPLQKIAGDDFKCSQSGPISWLRWWGIVLDPGQLATTPPRKYLVQIWTNGAGPCPAVGGEPCNPVQLLQSWCVTPKTKYAGKDCLNRKVYRFTATLTPAFVQTTGMHYWLIIAESDADSARQGVEDFRWATIEPITLCPAQQTPPITCSIGDDCPTPPPCDLTFELRRNCAPVVVGLPPLVLRPWAFDLEIRPMGVPLSEPAVWNTCLDLDDDGTGLIDPPLPDGQYNATLIGMGSARPTRPLTLMNGQAVAPLDFTGLKVANLDNNAQADGMDIPLIVDGLLNP